MPPAPVGSSSRSGEVRCRTAAPSCSALHSMQADEAHHFAPQTKILTEMRAHFLTQCCMPSVAVEVPDCLALLSIREGGLSTYLCSGEGRPNINTRATMH